MPHQAFAQMRYAFKHKLDIRSHYAMIHRVAILSGVEPVWYHCCINSCMAYTGVHSDLKQCRFKSCQEPRFAADGRPRRLFCYLPIIPRLQGFFQNPKKVEQLLYRHNYTPLPDSICDVFDGENYKSLCRKKVVVDGQELSHRYFSHKNNIALSICTDSYLLFERRRKGPSATPILAEVHNVPPNTRTHLGDLIYIVPFDDELALLAKGIPTYDSLDHDTFDLHAYNISGHGDILAVEKMMNIKGHNSLSPCRNCRIKGFRNVTGGETIYYVPLSAPCEPHEQPATWDPRNLPLRTHEHFLEIIDKIANSTSAAAEKQAKFHGIKGPPALRRVGSMDLARSYPWDFMHLLFENIIPNLVALWSGKYKGMDTGEEDYEISEEIWEEIWRETAEAMKDIPSSFCRSLAGGPSKFTAEAWCFWFVYMAPALLQGRFSDPKYHVHACDLSNIIKKCLQFVITNPELDALDEDIIGWVETYERYYYQYREDRLCACPTVIHGLIHTVPGIRYCGPAWATWTFYMEHYCGFLKSRLRSRKFPWANLNNTVLNYAYLEQIGARYDLTDELAIYGRRRSGPSSSEQAFEHYPLTILGTPRRKNFTPDDALRKKIAAYFASALNSKVKTIIPLLPQVMPSWGRVRVVDGDSIRAGSAAKNTELERNSSYIRYELQVPAAEQPFPDKTRWVSQVFYGRLEQVLVYELPQAGKDATEGIVSYNRATTTIVADVQAVSAVVGRMKTRGKWAIVDRTGGLIKPEFVTSVEALEEEIERDAGA
ncbi:hypothetical protein DFH06DRAFT_1418733 [Mycena polygramma]|nr:hypothetical protein DFH06DRAFT_1418733 [Mycena polygramma]